MDELLVSGTIALVVFYMGILLLIYGIVRVLLAIARAVLAGNYLLSGGILAGIAGVAILYGAVGLWLRRTEVI